MTETVVRTVLANLLVRGDVILYEDNIAEVLAVVPLARETRLRLQFHSDIEDLTLPHGESVHRVIKRA